MLEQIEHVDYDDREPSFFRSFHPPEFEVAVHLVARTAVIAVGGEVDGVTVGQVRAVMAGLAGRADTFVFDLSGVSFMDLAGLEPVVDQYRTDGRPSVGSASRIVRSLLAAADMESLEIPRTPREAQTA